MTADMIAAVAIAAGWVLAGLFSLRAGAPARFALTVGVAVAAASAAAAGAGAGVARRRARRRRPRPEWPRCSPPCPTSSSDPRARMVRRPSRWSAARVVGGVTAPDPALALVGFGAVAGSLGLAIGGRRARLAGDRQRRRVQWTYLALVIVADVAVVAGALHLLIDTPAELGPGARVGVAADPGERRGGESAACGAARRSGARGDGRRQRPRAPRHRRAARRRARSRQRARRPGTDGAAAQPRRASRSPACWPRPRSRGCGSPPTGSPTASRAIPVGSLRTFGTRMTRAVPLEELLQQLAELLHRHLRLTAAEVWTGTPAELQLVGAVPHRQPAAAAPHRRRSGRRRPGRCLRRRLARGVAPGAHGSRRDDPGGPTRARGRAPRPRRLPAAPRRGSAHRVGGTGPRRRRPSGRARDPQQPARLRPPGEPRAAADRQLRAARIACSHRGRVRRVAPPHRTQPARRRAAAPRRARREARARPSAPRTPTPRPPARCSRSCASDVQITLTELRELAHGIYPPLLRDRGLEEALRAACRAVDPVHRPRMQRRPALSRPRSRPRSTSAASRRCRTPGSTRAPTPSSSCGCTTTVPSVRFEVVDDGAGFDVAVGGGGHGFVNMADRLGCDRRDARRAIRAREGARRSRAASPTLAGLPRSTDLTPDPVGRRSGPARARRGGPTARARSRDRGPPCGRTPSAPHVRASPGRSSDR